MWLNSSQTRARTGIILQNGNTLVGRRRHKYPRMLPAHQAIHRRSKPCLLLPPMISSWCAIFASWQRCHRVDSVTRTSEPSVGGPGRIAWRAPCRTFLEVHLASLVLRSGWCRGLQCQRSSPRGRAQRVVERGVGVTIAVGPLLGHSLAAARPPHGHIPQWRLSPHVGCVASRVAFGRPFLAYASGDDACFVHARTHLSSHAYERLDGRLVETCIAHRLRMCHGTTALDSASGAG